MSHFEDNGFPAIAHSAGFDAVVVDAHFGYYMSRSLLPRLQEDIFPLAKAAGYKEIWFLGASMGGFGALLYTEQFSEDVSGLILLAPYLGDVTPWGGTLSSGEDYEIAVWKFVDSNFSSRDGIPIYLGFGDKDSRAADYREFGRSYPQAHMFEVEGRHDWSTWTEIWKVMASTVNAE